MCIVLAIDIYTAFLWFSGIFHRVSQPISANIKVVVLKCKHCDDNDNDDVYKEGLSPKLIAQPPLVPRFLACTLIRGNLNHAFFAKVYHLYHTQHFHVCCT